MSFMESKSLYQKYANGRHWEKHPIIYAKNFASFLKSANFKGLIVDIGCGNGRDVDIFSKLGFNSLGVDISKEEVISNKKEFPALMFDVQDVEKLKFKEDSIDAFFMINVIHYVNKEIAIQEIFRTLKPKGYFFVHFNIEIVDKTRKVDYYHNPKDVLKLVSRFKIIQQKLFERVDSQPIEHKHKIMELILQKS